MPFYGKGEKTKRGAKRFTRHKNKEKLNRIVLKTGKMEDELEYNIANNY